MFGSFIQFLFLISNDYKGFPIINDPLYGPLPKEAARPVVPADYTPLDDTCPDCAQPYAHPVLQDLSMCLHALAYRTPAWAFEVPRPDWAALDWNHNTSISNCVTTSGREKIE